MYSESAWLMPVAANAWLQAFWDIRQFLIPSE